jgi:hypothetical protein
MDWNDDGHCFGLNRSYLTCVQTNSRFQATVGWNYLHRSSLATSDFIEELVSYSQCRVPQSNTNYKLSLVGVI